MSSDRFRILLPCLVAVASGHVGIAPATAQRLSDRVRLIRGSESGEVADMTPLEVTLNKGLPGNRSVAVNEIKSVVFDGEPTELSQARVSTTNGNYQKALDLLEKVNVAEVQRDYIKQDIDFYKAFCAGKLALTGNGEIADAGRHLNSFVRSYPKSFHYLAATELMGDLLMADGRFEPAQKQFAELAKAPWPDYKMRATVAVGRTLQAQGKHTEAIDQFDSALTIPGDSADAENQKLAATLAKSVSQAETGQVEQAVRSIEDIIQRTDPEQKVLHARAYNALGNCYEKAGKTKDALLAFLHVDVLYNTVPEAHAEALSHMVPLWEAIGQQERARESRTLLQERYAGSAWAKQAE
jgi:tetratricopeptide (TPR) repeat protein